MHGKCSTSLTFGHTFWQSHWAPEHSLSTRSEILHHNFRWRVSSLHRFVNQDPTPMLWPRTDYRRGSMSFAEVLTRIAFRLHTSSFWFVTHWNRCTSTWRWSCLWTETAVCPLLQACCVFLQRFGQLYAPHKIFNANSTSSPAISWTSLYSGVSMKYPIRSVSCPCAVTGCPTPFPPRHRTESLNMCTFDLNCFEMCPSSNENLLQWPVVQSTSLDAPWNFLIAESEINDCRLHCIEDRLNLLHFQILNNAFRLVSVPAQVHCCPHTRNHETLWRASLTGNWQSWDLGMINFWLIFRGSVAFSNPFPPWTCLWVNV